MTTILSLLLASTILLGPPARPKQPCTSWRQITFGQVDREGPTYRAMLLASGEVNVDIYRSDRILDGRYKGELLPEDAAYLRCMVADLYEVSGADCWRGDHFYFGYIGGVNSIDRIYSTCLLDLPHTELMAIHTFALRSFCRASWCTYTPGHFPDRFTDVAWQGPLCLE